MSRRLGDGRSVTARARVAARDLWGLVSRRTVGGIIAVATVVMFGLGIVLPVVPLYARSLGASVAGAGVFVSVYGFVRLATDVAGGRLTDRIGVRAATLAGLVVLAAGAAATGAMGSYGAALGCWALTGAGSALVFAALYSYLLQTVESHEMARVLGLFYGSFNVGIIAGGPAGGFLAQAFGLSAPFFAYAVLLVLACAVYVMIVRAPAARASTGTAAPPLKKALRALLGRRAFVTACLGTMSYLWLVAAVFDTLVPLKGKIELGMSTAGIGVLFGVATFAELVTLYPAGAVADRAGRIRVLVPSTAALAVLTAVAGFATTALWFGILLCLLCLASGFSGVPPAAMLSDVVPDELSGTGVGVFRFSGDLGFVFGPLLASWGGEAAGFPVAFALSALPCVAVVILGYRTPETLRRSTGGPYAPGTPAGPET